MIAKHPYAKSLIRVAPYCRVSTDEEDQLNSLENQVSYYNDLFSKHDDWALADMYVDEGITGTSIKKRKDFKRLMDDAFAGKIDRIITKEVSRFARNTVDTLSYTRALKAIGVGVFFISDNIDTMDDDGEFRLTIMASVAQEESRKTSNRVKWGMKRQMERGYVFVNTIFGFHVVKGKLTIDENEAEIVRLIYNKFVYEKKGTQTIAKDLIDAGIPVSEDKRMKRWSAIAVTRILKNEKYVGDLLGKKTFIPNYLEHKSVKNEGQEEQVYIKDHHEGIISRDIWDRAQEEWTRRAAILDDKSRYSNAYWCSGKIFCSECGSGCIARTKNLKDGKYKAWRCKEVAVYGGRSGCNNGQINTKALESCIQFAIKQIDINDSFVQEIHEDIKRVQEQNINTDTQRHETSLNNLNKKKELLIDSMLEGIISKDEMYTMKQKYDAEIQEIQVIIKSIEEKNRKLITLNKNLKGLFNQIKVILEQDKPTPELYGQIVEKIVMYPTNDLDIYLKYIPDPISVHYETEGRGTKYVTKCQLREAIG